MLPVFDLSFVINRFISARSGSPVTFKCLYNAVILSRFTFCLNCRVDVASVASGFMNDVSSTCLYPVYCNQHNLRLEPVQWFLHQQIEGYPFYFLSVHFPFYGCFEQT